jgi:hypothetical protein
VGIGHLLSVGTPHSHLPPPVQPPRILSPSDVVPKMQILLETFLLVSCVQIAKMLPRQMPSRNDRRGHRHSQCANVCQSIYKSTKPPGLKVTMPRCLRTSPAPHRNHRWRPLRSPHALPRSPNTLSRPVFILGFRDYQKESYRGRRPDSVYGEKNDRLSSSDFKRYSSNQSLRYNVFFRGASFEAGANGHKTRCTQDSNNYTIPLTPASAHHPTQRFTTHAVDTCPSKC